MGAPLSNYAEVVPLNALSAHGLGPLARRGPAQANLEHLRSSSDGLLAAAQTVGTAGRQVLEAVVALGGSASAGDLAFQTGGAPAGLVDEAVARLAGAGLVAVDTEGGLTVAAGLRGHLGPGIPSLGDRDALTNDALALVCRELRVSGASRKDDRVAAIAAAFADPAVADEVRRDLTAPALDLLERIAQRIGPGVGRPEQVGLPSYLTPAEAPRYAVHRLPPPALAPLFELVRRGIVGVSSWDPALWIWREAWPLVGRPFFSTWSVVPEPAVAAIDAGGPRLPAAVVALDAALDAWELHPPAALKNGELRLGKAELRTAAKALGLDEQTLTVATGLAVGFGLLLRNVSRTAGRGRSLRFEHVWRPDPTLRAAWQATSPLHRWARLVAEWCTPAFDLDAQVLANRHLLLWELSRLPDDQGFVGEEALAAWLEDRYAPVGHASVVAAGIAELRALGVVAPGRVVGLTSLGRAVLDDPGSLAELEVGGATSVVVQADLTVVAPPDLRHDLVARLDSLAELRSSGGALVYRLDATRITRAVQAGTSGTELLAVLEELSSVPLPDVVVRLVREAAERAGAVRLVSGSTIVVVDDPADLVTALAIKALKLQRITSTVATTEVPLAKVRTALERKGLTPQQVRGPSSEVAPARSAVDDATRVAQRAKVMRDAARGSEHSPFAQHALALEEQAAALADVTGRLRPTGPLALTPRLVAALDAKATEVTAKAAKATKPRKGRR